LEYAVLGFVRHEPLHGYEIYTRMHAAHALGLVWHVKQAHLYAIVDRLEAHGLLHAEVVPQDGRPPKRLLSLTDAGQAAFDAWLRTPVAHGRDLRIHFLTKLFWAQREGPTVVAELIAQQRAACVTWLDQLQAEQQALDAAKPFATLVLDFRVGQTDAMLRWLDTCAATLAHELVLP
jgi:DNA-binding PadR family transcriptional regulator